MGRRGPSSRDEAGSFFPGKNPSHGNIDESTDRRHSVEIGVRKRRHGTRAKFRHRRCLRKLFTYNNTVGSLERATSRAKTGRAPVRPRVPRHLSFFASARARCLSCARFALIIADAMSRRKFTSTTKSVAMRGTQNTVVVKTPCLSK